MTMLSIIAHAQSGKHAPPKKPKEVPFAAAKARHAPGDTVGIVNGVVIRYADFMSIMSGYLKTFVARSKDNIVNDSLYTVIVDSSWNNAVTDIIIEGEIQKRKLEMRDAMVKDSLIEHPPEFLRRQFTDSTGTFHPEYMRAGLNDPHNDSVVHIIIEGERERLETEQLEASLAPRATGAERDRAFQAWLQHAKRTADIDDRRTRFGFY
jgi:SurA N-terminal domain